MSRNRWTRWTRRQFVETGIALPGAIALGTFGGALLLPATPACGDDDDDQTPTPRQMEGPYFKPLSPERTSLLEDGITGQRLTLAGEVLSTHGKPVNEALVDFWHCDADGVYDNDGYRLRGHLFTGADGRYELTTIMPGIYPGRTRHIHVKVQAPDKPVLTTQLYFPDEPGNKRDFIFSKALVVELGEKPSATDEPQKAEFRFVLDLG